jgi:hypothetical protein
MLVEFGSAVDAVTCAMAVRAKSPARVQSAIVAAKHPLGSGSRVRGRARVGVDLYGVLGSSTAVSRAIFFENATQSKLQRL